MFVEARAGLSRAKAGATAVSIDPAFVIRSKSVSKTLISDSIDASLKLSKILLRRRSRC
jgi:hypothetical protein